MELTDSLYLIFKLHGPVLGQTFRERFSYLFSCIFSTSLHCSQDIIKKKRAEKRIDRLINRLVVTKHRMMLCANVVACFQASIFFPFPDFIPRREQLKTKFRGV